MNASDSSDKGFKIVTSLSRQKYFVCDPHFCAERGVVTTKDTGDDVREAFCLFDMDGDGRISTKDLGTLVRSLGINPSEAQVRQMVREVDFNGTGHIELKDFIVLFSRHKHEVSTVDEVIEAFRVFDKDGNGYVSAMELRHVLLHLGEKLQEEEVNDMIREADISGDGQINYADFTKVLLAR